MLTLTVDQQTALAKRNVRRRVFIWCEAIDLDGVTPYPVGFWDDVGSVTLDSRLYLGSGNVIQVATLAAKGDLTIPGLVVTISAIKPEAAALVRGNMLAQRPITVSLGIFDVDSQALIGPLVRRFVGVVDDIDIITPEAGGNSAMILTCESSSRALTIKRTETRSQASLAERSASDAFYNYTAAQREQTIYFGRSVPTQQGSVGPPVGGA